MISNKHSNEKNESSNKELVALNKGKEEKTCAPTTVINNYTTLIKKKIDSDNIIDQYCQVINPFDKDIRYHITQSEKEHKKAWIGKLMSVTANALSSSEKTIMEVDLDEYFAPSVWETLTEDEQELLKMCQENKKHILKKYDDYSYNSDEEDLLKIEKFDKPDTEAKLIINQRYRDEFSLKHSHNSSTPDKLDSIKTGKLLHNDWNVRSNNAP